MIIRRILSNLVLSAPILVHALLGDASSNPSQAFLAKTESIAPLLDEILEAFQTAAKADDCASCHRMLLPFKALAQMGDGPFVKTVTNICIQRKIEDPDQCQGDVALQGPIVAHGLRKIATSGDTATRLCHIIFGMCDPLPPTPYNVTFPQLSPSQPKESVSQGRDPIQVVHISDVHVDREYVVGSEANCTKYLCCRSYEDQDSEIVVPAGPFGHGHCDSPAPLADSMLLAIKEFAPDAQFVISTGDIVDHANWLNTQSVAAEELHEFNQQLFSGLHTTFYGSFGDDSAPTNAFPRSTSTTANVSQWVFDLQSDDWERYIGSIAADVLRHNSGSYAITHPETDLRLISLNTNYWHQGNLWLYDSDEFQPDPNGVLSFLVQELQAAEDSGQRVWIFAHIPPGSSDIIRDQSNYYDQVVQRYRHTIAAQVYGHTHHDQFQIAYSDYSAQTAENAISFGLIGPSLTPTNGNPAFTVYDVDPSTYEIMDSRVYITNMTHPNYQSSPNWQLYYSARESYGPLVGNLTAQDSLNASFWHRLTEVFVANETAFQIYNERLRRGNKVRPCGPFCKHRTICGMRAMRTENNCDYERLPTETTAEPELDWKEEERTCGGNAIGGIFKGLLNDIRNDNARSH